MFVITTKVIIMLLHLHLFYFISDLSIHSDPGVFLIFDKSVLLNNWCNRYVNRDEVSYGLYEYFRQQKTRIRQSDSWDIFQLLEDNWAISPLHRVMPYIYLAWFSQADLMSNTHRMRARLKKFFVCNRSVGLHLPVKMHAIFNVYEFVCTSPKRLLTAN